MLRACPVRVMRVPGVCRCWRAWVGARGGVVRFGGLLCWGSRLWRRFCAEVTEGDDVLSPGGRCCGGVRWVGRGVVGWLCCCWRATLWVCRWWGANGDAARNVAVWEGRDWCNRLVERRARQWCVARGKERRCVSSDSRGDQRGVFELMCVSVANTQVTFIYFNSFPWRFDRE